jgi:PhzF family phenazine biosynthesis protein
MRLSIYQIDAFTDKLFHGNPAAICPLGNWLPDNLMQNIAEENNLAETGFFVRRNDHFEIRWFTPEVEVDLCGHATLAAAHVIFNYTKYEKDSLTFNSRSGPLIVNKSNNFLTLDFPVDNYKEVILNSELLDCFNIKPIEAYRGKTDYMLVFSSQQAIENIIPEWEMIDKIPCRGIITTARGNEVDFVSRFFAPQSGIPADPVTGSAHTTLTPYWAAQFGKNDLTALQLSKRRGQLKCTLAGERVEISGQAKTYLIGHIEI